jgi:hypothetical protein
MYALYSKSFAKKAVDLNKKEFFDEKQAGTKITAKGKAGGVEYEANSDQAKGDCKVTMPVDDKCSVSVKVESSNNSEVEAKLAVADGMDLTLIAKNPDLSKAGDLNLSGKFNYVTSAYSVESEFNLLNGGFKPGASAGITMDCPGLDGVVLGLKPGFTPGNTGVACPIALGYAGSGFDLAFVGGAALVDNKPALTGASFRGIFKVNGSTSLAFEVDHALYKMGKAGHDDFKKCDASNSMKLGLDYKISGSTSMKAKATFGGAAPAYDLSFKTALDGKSNLVFASQGLKTHSMTYTLEA